MKWIVTFLLLFSLNAFGQSIDYRSNLSDKSGRLAWLQYDNDFFAATDRYYSQGIALCYKLPVRETRFAKKLFLPLAGSRKQFGVGLDHMAFTPTTIAWDSVIHHDHPYAATIRLNFLFESIDSARQRSFSWMVSTGLIGPDARGKEMQTAIHRALENPLPKGWEHQVRNGFVLDLGINAQQRVLHFGQWMNLLVQESANAGTVRTDATLGTRLQVQYFTRRDRLRIVVYANPAVRFVGYDGTLQGATTSQRNEYTIAAKDVSRVILQREFGVNLQWGPMTATGVFQIQSHQYTGGLTHRWGGIRFGWRF